MNGSIFALICSLFYILLTSFVYFLKKRIDSIENKIFSMIVIVNIIGVVLDIISNCLAYNNPDIFLFNIVNKLYMVYLITWIYLFTYYSLIISFDKNKFINKYKMFICLYVILLIIVLLLPLYNKVASNYFFTYGPCASFLYGVSGVFIVIIIISMIMNFKNLKSKKYIPMFVYLTIGMTATMIQSQYPSILVITSMETFITILLFYTIENPDVKMIQQLEIAKDTADKANAAKTDFLSNMSHEIRTPLNAIVGFSDEIEQSSTLEDAKENAKDIISASNTLLEIVNSILDISKIEAGKLEIINSDYNPKEVFTNLAKLVTPKMQEKALDFQVSIADDLPNTLYGDKANIKKVVTNLLSNAYKYTDKGFVKYTVSCVKKDNNCRLIISVEDSGRGMKAENVDKLFTKFQRIDEDRNTTIEGTGLGLALTKQLLELMGGNIIVHTVYGEGSKFTATLDQRIDNIDLKEEVNVPDTIDLSNKHILVVDDNPLNLKVATKLLQRYNALVECCESGFACIDKVQAGEKFDLILMDDMMPKMSGTEAFKKLKEISSFNMPVIVLTANAITGMREKYLGEGFTDYLSKPIEKEAMIKSFNLVFKKSTPFTEKRDEKTSLEINVTYSDNTNEKKVIEKATPVEVKTSSTPVLTTENNHTKEFLESNNIDVNHGLELLGDMELYDETMADFVKEMESRLPKLQEYKDNSDMTNYAILVHAIKSDCKYLGIMALADMNYEHELKSKANDVEFVNSHYDELIENINKYLEICKNYIGN